MDEFSGMVIPEYNGKEPNRPMDDAATYEFAGWDKEISPVLTTTEYTAIYTSTPREYKVHWLNYDNSELAVSTVAYGSIPQYTGAEPIREGSLSFEYEFIGWDRELTPVKGECSYKATFNETNYQIARITYVFNDTVHEVVNPNITAVRAGTTVNLENPTCAGYDFEGWYLDSAHQKPAGTVLSNLPGDRTIYGVFNVHTYTISYEVNDGIFEGLDENPNIKEITCLDEFDLINPEKEGYKFSTWKDQNGKSLTKLSDVCEDLTLRAIFNANAYVITFCYAEQNDVYQTVYYDSYVQIKELSKDGYEFEGWYLKDDPTTRVQSGTYKFLKDITLVQHWSEPLVYHIEYDLDGGLDLVNPPETYTIEDQPSLPIPERPGYTFEGWYWENTKVELLRGIFPKNETRTLSLKAHWSANDVNITFEYDGGSLQRTLTFKDGDSYSEEVKISPCEYAEFKLLEDKPNAQFNGWYNSLNERETFGSDITVNKDTTLNAVWTPLVNGAVGAKIGEDATFEVSGMNEGKFQFTSLVDQMVTFESVGDIDVDAVLTKVNGQEVGRNEDDGENNNFLLPADLKANVTYILKVSSNFNGQGSVTIKTTSSAEHSVPQGKINAAEYIITSSKQKIDEKFMSVGTPVKDGMHFDGWQDSEGHIYNDQTDLKAESIALTAKWSAAV